MSASSDRLISNLVEDLEPVRPLPRLRQAFAVILVVWTTLLGVVLMTQEGALGVTSIFASRVYLSSFFGLLVASFGGTISALAAGVPGREKLEVGGMLVALIGLAAAAVACLIGVNALGESMMILPTVDDGMCFQDSAMMTLLPAGVILSFLVRGWTVHPARAAIVALLASGALGALIVHASCSHMAPRHLLMGHLTVPIVLVLLGIYPLSVVLRRMRN